MIDTREASKLISFAFDARHLPGKDEEYAALVRRYRDEDDFRLQVDDVADGFGLDVLDVSLTSGCVVAPREDSPFEMKLEDYSNPRWGLDGRLIAGLTHVAAVAWFFPTPSSFESDRVEWLTADELDSYLRSFCAALRRDTDGGEDPLSALPELEDAWRVYERWEAARETTDGRKNMKTTGAVCQRTLEWLADQGLLRRDTRNGKVAYAPLNRYRVQARELASSRSFADVHTLLAEGELPMPVKETV